MAIAEILDTMTYAPHTANAEPAKAWLKSLDVPTGNWPYEDHAGTPLTTLNALSQEDALALPKQSLSAQKKWAVTKP